MKIELGDRVKDKVTGFKGIVTGITSWLNGCRRIGIQPEKLMTTGKPVEAEWFDEQQVLVIKKSAHSEKQKRGGPMPDPRF